MATSPAATAGRRAHALPGTLVRAVPAWAWVAGLVVVSAALRYALARRIVAPWIMVDELIYSELAKSFAATGHLLVRGEPTGGYGPLYPILVSPAYALFRSPPDAYAAVKAINAVLVSLAAVPAYALARRVLTPPLAVAAAALSLALPSLLYSGNVMTENLFYPLFLTAALALVAYLERPTLARLAGFLALCAVAYLTRPQAIALVPAALTAALLLGPRRYRSLPATLAALALALLAVQAARGRSLGDLLGAYRATTEESYSAGAVAKWLLYHVAELDLYVGVVPLAALLALLARRGLPRELRVFAVAAGSLAAWFLLEVAAFATLPSVERIEERYLFYLAPLLLVALLAWIERGAPRGRGALLAAAAAGILPAALPFNSLIGHRSVADTLQLLPWWRIHDVLTSDIRLLATLAACAAAALFLVVPRRAALVLPALLAVYLAVTAVPIEARVRQASLGSLWAGIRAEHRDWIDRAVPPGREVVALHSGNEGSFAIWENEFFNRRVGRVAYLNEPTGGNLPETHVTADPRTGVLRDGRGRPLRARYVLTDTTVTLAGRVVARDERRGMLVYRLSGPVRSTTRVTGLYPSDTWSGAHVRYRRLDCSGGTVTAYLQGDPSLFRRPQTVTARVAGRVVARARVGAEETPLAVPLRARGGRCVADFSVSPTAVPSEATRGASPDDRVLGVHFNRFDYRPA